MRAQSPERLAEYVDAHEQQIRGHERLERDAVYLSDHYGAQDRPQDARRQQTHEQILISLTLITG